MSLMDRCQKLLEHLTGALDVKGAEGLLLNSSLLPIGGRAWVARPIDTMEQK